MANRINNKLRIPPNYAIRDLKNIIKKNAAARHIEKVMTSPHYALGRKLLLRQFQGFQPLSNELQLGEKRRRNNNNSSEPRNQRTNETNENYRRYLLQWLRNKNMNLTNNAALNRLRNVVKKGKWKK